MTIEIPYNMVKCNNKVIFTIVFLDLLICKYKNRKITVTQLNALYYNENNN